MKDKFNRRHFIAFTGASIASSTFLMADDQTIDSDVAAELKNRMKFLSPPDGIASDLDVRPSPRVVPFATDLFVPKIARPLIDLGDKSLWVVKENADGSANSVDLWFDDDNSDLSSPAVTAFLNQWMAKLVRENAIGKEELAYLKSTDKAWLTVFYKEFRNLSDRLLTKGIDIGAFPLPSAHQRFFDFLPMKFYAIWEMEFPWTFSDVNCDAGPGYVREGEGTDKPRELKGADWDKGSWSWGFAQLIEDEKLSEAVDPKTRSRPQGVKLGRAVFEAMSPGPTFKAKYNEPIMVRRINQLPEILNDDHTWTDAGDGTPRRNIQFALPSTTTHLHNAHTASESDGHPNDWINPGEYWDHHYGNFPSGYDNREKLSTLWYHDHRMDFTASNVYAGLDGFYFLFDEEANLATGGSQYSLTKKVEQQSLFTQSADLNDEAHGWRLPAREFDIPLIFHDLLFEQDDAGEAQLVFDGFNTDGILGDRYTVNRVIQPRLSVKRRKYRFRLLNGGPSRFYEVFLHTTEPGEYFDKNGRPTIEGSKSPPRPFVVIAGDGNFQPNPLLARSIYIGVAQRNDVIIDFSSFKSDVKHVYLVNRLQQTNGRGPNGRHNSPKNEADIPAFLQEFSLVRFDLEDGDVEDESRIPLEFREFPPVDLTEVRRERSWDFDYDGGLWTINGLTYEPNRIDAGIEQDSAEIWTLRNTGNSWSHPIHSHFTEFIVLEINGVPQYQSAIQSSDVPRRSQAGFFQSEKQLTQGFEKILDQKKESIPKILEQGRVDYTKALRVRDQNQATHIKGLRDLKVRDAEPESQVAVQSTIKKYESSLLEYSKRDTVKQPYADPRFPGDIWFFYKLLLFLLYDEGSPKPKYGLITDPLRALIGVPGSVSALEILRQVRFEHFDQFVQAVLFMKDSEFWNEVLEGDGEDKEFANLDLRGNGDKVKGDGRFMGGPRRDVALILPNWEVKVFMRWKDFLGKHVMHCHNVVHEDHAMMIRWDIVPPGHGFDTPKYTTEVYGAEEGIPHVQPAPAHSQSHLNDADSHKGR